MAALALVPKPLTPAKWQFAPRATSEPTTTAELNWLAPTAHGIALAHASVKCTFCHGAGLILSRGCRIRACSCVYRRIFQSVLARRRKAGRGCRIPVNRISAFTGTRRRSSNWGWKQEEFRADVDLAALRELTPLDYRIFRLRYYDHREARQIAVLVGRNRGDVFHRMYAIEQQLGRAFVSIHPYALYPIDEYFHGKGRTPTTAPRKALAA